MKHIAILGSSLISVIEAITQAKLGNKVSIIDKSEKIGGAWKLENSLNYKDVEVGCHILIPTGKNAMDKESYSRLESLTGTKLIKLKSQPINITVNPVSDKDPEDIEYYYPKNGLPELLKNLRNAIDENSIEYLSEHEVTEIKLNSASKVTIKANDNSLIFDKVTFPSYFGINQIETETGDIEEIPYDKRTSTHISLKVKGNTNKFSYCQLEDNGYAIDRVSRVSDYIPGLDLENYDVFSSYSLF